MIGLDLLQMLLRCGNSAFVLLLIVRSDPLSGELLGVTVAFTLGLANFLLHSANCIDQTLACSLSPICDRALAFARQQWDNAHLTQIQANRIVCLLERAG